MIEVAPGLWVEPSLVAAVKDLGGGKCAVFTPGQSAVDGGFLVERDAEDVVQEIEDMKESEEE